MHTQTHRQTDRQTDSDDYNVSPISLAGVTIDTLAIAYGIHTKPLL